MYNLTDKTAIVGGGSGLIGKAVCKLLEEYGAEVINADICAPEPIDVSDAHDIYNLLKLVSPDIFVSASYPTNYRKHLMAFLVPLQIVSKAMWFNGGGVIVNVASIYGMMKPYPWIYPFTGVMPPPEWYHKVKAEIIEASQQAAEKFAPHVRVNCVSPGGVEDNTDGGFDENYAFVCPLERMATPREVAEAVLFLAGHEYITGVNLPVSGGMEL